MKKATALLCIIPILCCALLGAAKPDWQTRFDTALPDLEDGTWEQTLYTDFTTITSMEELLAAKWAPSPHGLRNYEYWCDQMIEFSPDGLIIHSEQQENHDCAVCRVTQGVFTGGIETRKMEDGIPEQLFAQAFGYFEATVIVPRGTGMWSAFWLQSDSTGNVGYQGQDGSEIDIYESSFLQKNPTKTGQAIHYDAYDAPFYRSSGNVTDMGYNLYDGQPHTYALKWTPDAYVFYVDGTAVWASNYGGVSRTPEYLRLTVEIRDSNWGPYTQEIGTFQNHDDGTNDFIIQTVKVYQNTAFTDSIQQTDGFEDRKPLYLALIIGASVFGGAALICGAVALGKKLSQKRKNKA